MYSHLCIIGIKHHDQCNLSEGLFRDKSPPSSKGELKQSARQARCHGSGSARVISHLNTKPWNRELTRHKGSFVTSKPIQSIILPPQDCTSNSPPTDINWGPSIQISEPKGGTPFQPSPYVFISQYSIKLHSKYLSLYSQINVIFTLHQRSFELCCSSLV